VTPSLGIDLANLTQDLRARYKIKDSIKGVVIVGVHAGSVAAEKQLAAGEVIIEAGREPVSDLAQVQRIIGQLEKNGSRSALLLVSKADGELRYLALPMQ
jgi:serine protease Do